MNDVLRTILRNMTPAQKLQAFYRLRDTAMNLKRAALRARWPEASRDEIERKTKDAFLHAQS